MEPEFNPDGPAFQAKSLGVIAAADEAAILVDTEDFEEPFSDTSSQMMHRVASTPPPQEPQSRRNARMESRLEELYDRFNTFEQTAVTTGNLKVSVHCCPAAKQIINHSPQLISDIEEDIVFELSSTYTNTDDQMQDLEQRLKRSQEKGIRAFVRKLALSLRILTDCYSWLNLGRANRNP